MLQRHRVSYYAALLMAALFWLLESLADRRENLFGIGVLGEVNFCRNGHAEDVEVEGLGPQNEPGTVCPQNEDTKYNNEKKKNAAKKHTPHTKNELQLLRRMFVLKTAKKAGRYCWLFFPLDSRSCKCLRKSVARPGTRWRFVWKNGRIGAFFYYCVVVIVDDERWSWTSI